MNREELKEALWDLAEQEPDFMKDLIKDVVKNNLSIDTWHEDWCDPSDTYVLKYDGKEFSKAE